MYLVTKSGELVVGVESFEEFDGERYLFTGADLIPMREIRIEGVK